MWICSHLLNKFLMKKFIFCALIYSSKQTENTVKKKIIYFTKIILLLYLHFSKKSLQKVFTARRLDVRFWDLLFFICLKFNPQYWYILLLRSFSHFFKQKLFIYTIHLSLIMHTIQINTISSKSGIFLVKVQSGLSWWNSKPLSLNEF